MSIEAASLKVVVSADTSKAEGDLKSFSSSMKGMAGGLGAVGGVMAAAISAPLIGIGVTAVNTAATFERSMNVLQYVTDSSGASMQAMSDLALQLGADTVFSANEAAEGMVELAKAGMDTEQVMDSIAGVMDLAAAGAIGVEEAATLASATLNTFGLEASKAGEVADILAAAANASSADIRDLAFGVQNAGSVFASSGQSVETLATMMALLANNGLNASDAATSLKTMTMRLTAPTDKAAAVMKKLGIAVFNTDGSMRDYQDIIGDLESATRGLSDEQRSAAFNTIFGQDAIRSALILAQEGAEGYEAMAAAVGEQGAAAAMAQAQNSGLAGAMEQIGGSVESLMTKLALPFLEGLAEKMGQLEEFVDSLGELPQPVINAGLAFLGLAAGIGLFLVAAAGVAAVVGALATPIGLAVLVVLGLGLAVGLLWTAWEMNWGNIQDKTSAALSVIQPLLDTLSTTLATIGATLGEFGSKITTSLAEAEIPTWDELFADLLKGDFGALASKLQKALDSLVLNLKIQFQEPPASPKPPAMPKPEPMPKIPSFESFAIPATNSIMQGITDGLAGQNWQAAGTNITNGIIDAVVNAFTTSGKIVAGVIPFVARMQMAFNEAMLGLGEKWSAQLGASLSALSTNLAQWLTDSAALLETNFMGMVGAFDTALTGFLTGIRDALMDRIKGIFGGGAGGGDAISMSDTLRTRQAAEVDWGEMPEFTWPAMPEFKWPTLPTWEWPTLPTWEWPNPDQLYNWDWPNMSMPGWVGTLISALGGAMNSLRGGGGSSVGGGGPVPGERPQELPIDDLYGFSAGSQGAYGSGVTINVHVASVNNGMDIEVLAAQLAKRFQQKMRR